VKRRGIGRRAAKRGEGLAAEPQSRQEERRGEVATNVSVARVTALDPLFLLSSLCGLAANPLSYRLS